MTMTMKKFYIIAAAAIAALSACSKEIIDTPEEITDPEEIVTPEDTADPVFTATIEGWDESDTQLVEGSTAGKLTKVAWLSTDKVNIHGAVYTVTPGDPATTATLTKESGTAPEAIDGKYYAVYPSSIAFNTSTKTITLPATQTYNATTNGIGNVPMVAVSETTELQFKIICAVLAVTVPSGDVKNIKVVADKNLSGDFTLDPSTSDITATTTGSNTVVLECSTAVSASNTTFYIAIPPQEYSSLQIYLSADGTTYKEAMATKVAAGLGTIARNTIIPITYAKNAVQLWADGPYFSTENVGGTQKFKWGATVADDEGTANSGDYDLEHDTAYKLWGSAWRMPTNDEYVALVSNCTLNFDESGVKFDVSSKTSGYGSISFTATIEASSYSAQYWTSTENSSGWSTKHICILGFMKGGYSSVMNNSTTEYSTPCYVRAVLATPVAAPAVTPDPTPAPTSNLLAGEFSVSPTKKVKFTKGNLYWDGSAYQFEANQTAYPEAWNTSHVGHFYWSQTAAVAYEQTYSDGSRGTTDKLFCGEDNKLTVSGTSDLYVLSAEEWHYLTGLYNEFSYSGNRSDAYRFANARVNGKAGLLIFPDGYNGTVSGDGIAEVNNDEVSNENYPSASIPDATWSDMEAAGVVFLPAAGCRSNQKVENCGNNGYYWSSTLIDKDNACMLYDYYGIVDCPKNQKRERGCSIRLVKTVE